MLMSLAGCDGGPAAPWPESDFAIAGPVVAAERVSYSWEKDSDFVWSLSNPDGVDVFYNPGNHVHVDRWDGEQWDSHAISGAFTFNPVRLSPGATQKSGIRLSSFDFPKSGWYRVQIKLYRDTATTTLWPIGNRVSAAVWVGP
jgi:hypothetical protein